MSFTGPNDALQLFGVTLIGMTPENGRKLLLTFALIFVLWFVGRALASLIGVAARGERWPRVRFWARQSVLIASAAFAIIGVISIWFDDPTRLATALGLITAGVAFALQRVITALAGYFVILRGKTFNVGDRIVMGGVRGDVIGLGFMQTKIMEMGQPPSVQNADPAMWVRARQYTGRIVTVSNANIFDEPVYNYSRPFGVLFEELTTPIRYDSDWRRAEAILLDVAVRHTAPNLPLSQSETAELQRRYFMRTPDLDPRVYVRMTDNWLELTVRFIAREHGVRELKDAMTRDILAAYDKAGVQIASATFELVGAPAIQVRVAPERGDRQGARQ